MEIKNVWAVIPAYNEEGNIRKVVKDAEKVLQETANKHEIIIVLYEHKKLLSENTNNVQKNNSIPKIIIKNDLYSGVIFKFQNQKLEITKNISNKNIYLQEGKFVIN